jgi:large subunit ribosomal protein L17
MSRHLIRGRQLSRDTEHRKALRRNLVQSLFEHNKIKTTLPKAKEVQGFAEKLITVAVKAHNASGDEAKVTKLNARRKVVAELQDRKLVDENQDFIEKGAGPRSVVEKLFTEIAPKFADTKGGYTRIIKLPQWRIGDAASLVSLELVTEGQAPRGTARKAKGLRRKKAEKRHAFAGKILKKFKKGDAPAEAAPA